MSGGGGGHAGTAPPPAATHDPRTGGGEVPRKPAGASQKLLAVLTSFEEAPLLRLGEIAQAVRLPKSTVHRLLCDLAETGLVERTREGGYRLGYRMWRLGRIARPYDALVRLARPHLRGLAERSRESAFLTVREGRHSVCIDAVEGPEYIRMSLRIDATAPLHLGASNRILLAFLPVDESHHMIQRLEPDATRRERLWHDLARIRSEGYAYSTAQLTPGASAIAVPVLDRKGGGFAGLSVGGPTDRFPLDRARALLPDLFAAANALADARESEPARRSP
jgi:DNA-binding IclR family transcriptional regulator